MIRAVLARRRFKKLKEKRMKGLHAGIAPEMRGKLKLSLARNPMTGADELMLALTTPHRRDKAATRIQVIIWNFDQ